MYYDIYFDTPHKPNIAWRRIFLNNTLKKINKIDISAKKTKSTVPVHKLVN